MADCEIVKPIVALVTDAIFPYHRGGKEMRYHVLAHRLVRHVDVHVYTMHWWKGPRVRREGGVTFHAICPRMALYAKGRRSVPQAVVFAVACLRLSWQRFDLIEADHMPYFQLFPLWLITRLRSKKLVVTWHECWGPEYWREYLGPVGRIGWWVERAAMQLPDHIIAASEQTGERLREYVGCGMPLTIAPNGIDLERIGRAAPALDGCDVVVVGRLLTHKRLDLLLDALAILHAQGTPTTCRIIGNGPAGKALRDRARALEIADAVQFCHDVGDDDELYSHVKGARAFVFPSEREGFGIAVLEAIACGVPVITTTAPDNLARHLVGRSEKGVLCAPNAAALASAMAEVMNATNGADRSRQGEAWLAEYDWTAVTSNVAKALLA
jgi:glycosyltransferase involved in cell wall biosynthesis